MKSLRIETKSTGKIKKSLLLKGKSPARVIKVTLSKRILITFSTRFRNCKKKRQRS